MAIARVRDEDISRTRKMSEGVGRPDVGEAISRCLNEYAPGKDERHRKNQKRCGENFMAWLTKRFGRTRIFWEELGNGVIHEYATHLAGRKLAANTVRLALQPVLMTSRFMAGLDPASYHVFTVRHAVLKLPRPRKLYFSRPELFALIEAARKTRALPEAEAAVLLSGFCGLRAREVARLEFEDIDRKRRLITVRDGKTRYSDRTIPAPAWVIERVAALFAGRKYLFTGRDGKPQVAEEGICRKVKTLFERVKGAKGICPRDLRKSFANVAIGARVPSDHLRAYLGQAARSVLESNYAEFGDLDLLRAEVVDRIETFYSKTPAKVVDAPRKKAIRA
jgi:integrase